jgi:BirA family biotin operon repressor/biotin-[acetyl-CoA-carboxylase] ligase
LINFSAQRFVHHESIDSTNAEAQRLWRAGERGPLWISAAEQTGGRGRLGRNWVSKPGNLYATYLFTTEATLQHCAQIGFVAALAVREVALKLAPRSAIILKWPNDVLLGGAKFCGILADVVGSQPSTVILGCGINLAHAPDGMPYPVAALGRHPPRQVLELLAGEMERALATWAAGRGFDAIREAWLSHTLGLGEPMTLDGAPGTFGGLSAEGALIMHTPEGATRLIHAGDARFSAIDHLRRAHA